MDKHDIKDTVEIDERTDNTVTVERRETAVKSRALSVARVAIMAALLIVGKFALQFVPNIEVVTTLVVVFAYTFGFKAVFATLIFCTLDMVLYPFSLDVAIANFIHWDVLALVVAIVRRTGAESLATYLLIALVMTLLFGVLTSALFSLVFGTPFVAVYLAGLLFYGLHLFSTLAFMTVGFKPLTRVLAKICT